MPDSPDRASRGRALTFIFVTVLIDMMALGLIVPALPKLLLQFQGGDVALAATTYGAFNTAWALMQFGFSPILGVLSDRFGRRPIILLSILGTGIDYVIMALAPSLGWLLAGRVLSGITTASMTAANGYVADETPPEKRAGAYGMFGAAFGIGFVFGPALGGFLASVNTRLPFWAAAAFALAGAFWGLFVLPESLPPEGRTRFSWRRANPLGALRLLGSHREIAALSVVNFIEYVVHEVLPNVFVLYVVYRYAWSSTTIGASFAVVGVAFVLVSAFVVQRSSARFGDRGTLMIGLCAGAIGFAMFGLASSATLFWIAIVVNSLSVLAGPASQALMTRRVTEREQGELQGALASMRGIAMLIGPLLFTATFSYFIDPHRRVTEPGAPWFLASALMLLAIVVAWRTLARSPEPA
jgi:DHA1 family tetracycline resistance protein-like MFS transporter